MTTKIKYRSRSEIVRSTLNTVNGSLWSTKLFLTFDAPDENGLVEYAIDNDMIEYQRNLYKNRQDR